MLNNSPVTTEELNAFVSALSAHINALGRAEYPTCELNWDVIIAKPGKKYAKLIRQTESTGQSRGAFGFIDLTNGDIFKAASWAAPAKHARGNIRRGDASNGWNNAVQHGFIPYL